MKPGRELDKKVAKILGWTWDGVTAISPTGSRNSMLRDDPFEWLPYYSSETSDAWAAWGWLEKNNPWEVDSVLLGRSDGEPCVFIQPRWVECEINCIRGRTYPIAICLAVLEAVKVVA